MKNSNVIIGNRTRDIPTCSAVPQPTAPPRAPRYYIIIIMNVKTGNKFYERRFFHEIIILLVSLPTEPSYLQLDLSYNALSFLHEEVTHWESLESANLQGNPWDCTCRLQWVLNKVLPLMYHSSQDQLYELRLVNPLNPELNPICYLLALLGAHHFLHVSRIRVKLLTLRLLMCYTYGAPILDVSRSHTTTQHSR